MNHPFVIRLPKVENNLDLKSSEKIIYTSIIPYPLFALGFHSFIHRTRSAFGITKNLQTKTQFYYVVNPFEINILNYDDDISKSTKKYLKVKDDIQLLDFYKIWETIFIFDIASQKNMEICILSNQNSEVIESSIKLYREKVIETSKKDSFYTSEKDINKLKNNSCDLIIGNSKQIIEDENFVEQESYAVILSEIIKILKNQKEGGNAILEIYDTFTILTLKMIYILCSFYTEVSIYKPFVSRNSDADKYLILKGFNSNKKMEATISILEEILKLMNSNKYISDILPDLVVPKEFIGVFKFINIKLVNNQQIMVNEIIKYIKENNYFGDKYHAFRDKQIESKEFWINNFYPPSVSIYEKTKKDLDTLYKTIQTKLNAECTNFIESLNL
jgi:hypothetical protein